jgi:type I restriction enzyme, S subunit
VSGWKAIPLGDLAASVDYGVTASASEQPVGPKFLRITDIQDGTVDWEGVPWCECDTRSASDARLKAGDIVFARTGATTGKSLLISDCPPDAVFASYLIRVRLRDVAEPRFVSHFFQTPDYWAQITKSARGVAQPGVNATTLKALKIPLPPLREQRRIADILDKADALRTKRRAALARFDALTQSIFLNMVGDPATNPKGWPRSTLRELGKVKTGGTPPSAKSGMFDGPIPFVTPGDLESDAPVKRSVTEAGAAECETVRPGATLVCCIGATIGKIGRAAVRSAFNQQINAVEWGESVHDTYGHAVLRFFKPTIVAWGASTTLPILKKSAFEKIEIPVPNVELQAEFAARSAEVDKLARSSRTSLDQCDDLFAALQARAFQGEL